MTQILCPLIERRRLWVIAGKDANVMISIFLSLSPPQRFNIHHPLPTLTQLSPSLDAWPCFVGTTHKPSAAAPEGSSAEMHHRSSVYRPLLARCYSLPVDAVTHRLRWGRESDWKQWGFAELWSGHCRRRRTTRWPNCGCCLFLRHLSVHWILSYL